MALGGMTSFIDWLAAQKVAKPDTTSGPQIRARMAAIRSRQETAGGVRTRFAAKTEDVDVVPVTIETISATPLVPATVVEESSGAGALIVGVLILGGIGVGGYYGYKYLFGKGRRK